MSARIPVPPAQVPPEELARYVPCFIRRRAAAGTGPEGLAFSERSVGTALFADISGFTPLSERLTTKGPEGVEQLALLLNAYFGQLIDLITLHGGDIARFAGDALLAFWPLPDESRLAQATLQAAACGLAIQAALRSFQSPAGDRLSLRVGLGSGELSMVSLGGVHGRYDFVVSGPAVVEAAKAATSAQPGSLVCGAQAWKLIAGAVKGASLSADHTRVDEVRREIAPVPLESPVLEASAIPALLAYIPASIHRRLAARHSGWLAELRRITVVFVSLPSLDQMEDVQQAQGIMRAVQTELYRFEGSVNKLGADDKGVTLVAAMGLPPLVHEDDEVRATLAALGIHQGLGKLGVAHSIGIHSGLVFCGTVGNATRCEYSLVGDVVNMTARLMQSARGEVLCAESIHRKAHERVAFQPLEPIKVKGKDRPAAIFRPLGLARPPEVARAAPPIVGRGTELARIGAVLERLARERRGGVVFVEGHAGLGKSRLVAEVVDLAEGLDLAAMVGPAEAVQRSTSYYAWRPVFQRLFRLGRAPVDSGAQRRRVVEEIGYDPMLEPLAPLLGSVLSVDFPDNPTTAQMFGEVRISNTNDLLVRLLARRAAAQPLVVVLEDCHWMDSASWALAAQAAREIGPLVLLIATRPLTDPARPVQELLEAPGTERLELLPLDEEQGLALIQQQLGVSRLPEAVARLLVSRAQGNPFFARELAYALLDSGTIRVADGRCVVAAGFDPETLALPDTVQGVITTRIDRLPPEEQLTLKVASVVGRVFSHAIVRDVCPIAEDREQQRSSLATLVSHQLVDVESSGEDPRYRFHHVITQEVAYQLMPPGQRRSLHRSVAEWYEEHHAADLSPFYPLLAKHYSQTDRSERAIDYLERSGQRALRDYANQEAVAFFGHALRLAEQSPLVTTLRKACWERQLGEAHYNLGSLSTALVHFQRALQLLGFPFPETAAGMVASTLWEMAKQTLHRLFPARFVGSAIRDPLRVLEAARAYERLAQIRYLDNAKVPTIHAAFRSLNLSETVGDSPELARSYANAAVVTGLLRLHGVARAHAARAQRVARVVEGDASSGSAPGPSPAGGLQKPSTGTEIQGSACTAYVAFIRGVYWATVGAWDLAVEDLSGAVAIAERIGERRRWWESTFTLANVESRRGDLRRAADLSRQLHEPGPGRVPLQIEVWGLSWRLWCLLALEPESSTIPTLEAALAERLEGGGGEIPCADQILGWGLAALTRWRLGEAQRSRAAAEAAEDIVRTTSQISHYLLAAYHGLAEVYTGLWGAADEAGVRREMRLGAGRACGYLAQLAGMYPIGGPRRWLAEGRCAVIEGRVERARRAFGRVVEEAARLRMPYEEALGHQALGGLYPPGAPEGRGHLERAAGLFEQVGIGGGMARGLVRG